MPEPYDERDLPAVPRSPSGRVPQWALDEAAGVRPQDTAWRQHAPMAPLPGGRRPHRSRSTGGLSTKYKVGLGVLAGFLVALLAVDLLSAPADGPAQPPPMVADGPPAAERPAVDGAELPANVETDVAGLRGTGYRFLAENPDGTPVGYDPCRPLDYVINPRNAPVGGEQLVHEAMASAASAIGMSVSYAGTTDEPFAKQRSGYQPERYGEVWAPVLVTWPTEWDNPDFATENLAGQGGSTGVTADGRGLYVSGQIQLGANLFDRLLRDGERGEAVAIIKHEVGHVLGLDHVNDPDQLMYPEQQGGVEFGAGDLAGLAHLGSMPCGPELRPGGG